MEAAGSRVHVDEGPLLPGATRYAYVKNGDVIEQYQRYRERGVVRSGPDAFVSEFLAHCSATPLLLLSRASSDRELEDGLVTARVYGDGVQAGTLRRLCTEAAAFAGTLRRIVAFRPHVIVCGRSGPMLWAAGIASRLVGAPLLHARHTRVTLKSPLAGALGAVDNFFIRRAAAVVCHGPFLRDQLTEAGVDPARIREFDVTLERPSAAGAVVPALHRVPEAAKIILYVGRIKRSKGVLDLFDAALPLVKADPDVHLVFVGDGPDSGRLSRRIEKHGVTAAVHLTGRLSEAAITPVMARALVLVTPTRRAIEGRSMAVMEGLVAGVPVIAPDSGPFPYLIRHGYNGLLYATDAVADLRAQLERVLGDEALRSRLIEGARASGDALLRARPLSFVGAVRSALDASGRQPA